MKLVLVHLFALVFGNGKLVGEYSELVGLSQYVDVFYSSKPLQRGRLASCAIRV